MGALDASELPEPLFTVTAQTSSAPPCPTPGVPSHSSPRTLPVSSGPSGRCRDPPPSAGLPRPVPLLPAQPSSLPRSRLSAAPSRLLPRLHCRRLRHRRVRQGRAGSRSPGTRAPLGAGLPHGPDGAAGPGGGGQGAGRLRGPGTRSSSSPAAWRWSPRSPPGAVSPGERARPSSSEQSLPSSRLRPPPLAGLSESGRGGDGSVARGSDAPRPRVWEPRAAGPRPTRTLRAGPAAVQRGAARLGRSSGAVPAQSGSAPHTCLCPAPGDVVPSDWHARAGGRGRGR